MKLTAPKKLTWWIAVILGLIGILLELGILDIVGIGKYAFGLLAIAFILLVLATLVKGM